MEIAVIQNKIYEIRDHMVILDYNLAELYEVEIKVLNQSVKRNIKRFPLDFMFQLTKDEWQALRSQIVTLEMGRGKFSKYLPFAFTEHGVAMLASILKSERAVQMNIAIVRAFIALRQFTLNYKELRDQINDIRKNVSNHNEQLSQIYDAIEHLLRNKREQQAWKDRERIGYK